MKKIKNISCRLFSETVETTKYKKEYEQINNQIIDLQLKQLDILAQAVKAKGLKQGTKFKVNNLWYCQNKIFCVVDKIYYKQLKNDGTINELANCNKLNFDILDNVEIVKGLY